MLKRALTYFVLMMVVLQSSMATGDARQLQQSADEIHQYFSELVAEKHHAEEVGSDDSSSAKWDCPHCCDCHGYFCCTIVMSAERILLSKSSSPVPDYSENAFPDTFETLLRPPKA